MKKYWFVCITPAILFLVVLVVPLGKAVFYSFTSYNVISSPVLTGFNNYTRMLQDSIFWASVLNFIIICSLSTITATIFSFFVYRGTKHFSKTAKVVSGALLTSYSVFSFVPITLPYFFASDSYGLINSFLLNIDNKFSNLNIISKPVNFSGDPFFARIIAFLLIAGALVAPIYLLLVSYKGPLSKALFLSANFGIITALLVTFLQIPFFGLPSANFIVHTPLIHMFDYGYTRYNAGYMYALLISTIIIVFIFSGTLSILFYFVGKISFKGKVSSITKTLSVIILVLKPLMVIVMLVFSFSKILQPIDERFLFPAKFFVRRPTLYNIITFFESGIWKDVLSSLTVQTILGLIVFVLAVLPAGFALSHSRNMSKFLVAGVAISLLLAVLPLGMMTVETYTARGFLSAALSPFLVLSIFVISKAFSGKNYISGISGGSLLVLLGSFTNAGIMGRMENPGLAHIFIHYSSRDYFSSFLIFGIIFITAVLGSFFVGFLNISTDSARINLANEND